MGKEDSAQHGDLVSALMDGELCDGDATAAIALIKKRQDLAQAWATYHLIGDAMKQAQLFSEDYDAKFARRLAEEPTVLAPRKYGAGGRKPPLAVWSVAASAAAVALVAWVAWQPSAPERSLSPTAPLARVEPPATNPLPNRGSVNDYLIAHQEFSPNPATVQAGAPYMLTAFEAQGDVAR